MNTEGAQDSPRHRALEGFKELIRKGILQKQGSGNFSPSSRRPSVDSPISARLKNPAEKPTTDLLLRLLLRKDKPDEIGQMLYRCFKDHKFFRNLAKSYTHIEEDEAFSHIMKSSTLEVFAANQLIYKEGDNTNGKIYLILLGEVDIYKRNSRTPRPGGSRLEVLSPRSRRHSNASSFDQRSQIVLEEIDGRSNSSSDDFHEGFGVKDHHGHHHPHHRGGDKALKPGDTIHSRRPSFNVGTKSQFAHSAEPTQRKSFIVSNISVQNVTASMNQEIVSPKPDGHEKNRPAAHLAKEENKPKLLIPETGASTSRDVHQNQNNSANEKENIEKGTNSPAKIPPTRVLAHQGSKTKLIIPDVSVTTPKEPQISLNTPSDEFLAPKSDEQDKSSAKKVLVHQGSKTKLIVPDVTISTVISVQNNQSTPNNHTETQNSEKNQPTIILPHQDSKTKLIIPDIVTQIPKDTIEPQANDSEAKKVASPGKHKRALVRQGSKSKLLITSLLSPNSTGSDTQAATLTDSAAPKATEETIQTLEEAAPKKVPVKEDSKSKLLARETSFSDSSDESDIEPVKSTPKKSFYHQDSKKQLNFPDSSSSALNIPLSTQESVPNLSQRKSIAMPSLVIPHSNKELSKEESPAKSKLGPSLNIPATLLTPNKNNLEPRKSFLASTQSPPSDISNIEPRKSFLSSSQPPPSMEPRKSFLAGNQIPNSNEPRKSKADIQLPDAILNLLPGGQRRSFLMTDGDGTMRRKSFLGQDNEIKLGRKIAHDIIVHHHEQYGELEEKKLKDDYFGDKILGKDKKRTETAIAVSRTEVVVLKKQAFEALEKKFNKMKMQFKQHMMKYFPSVGDYSSKTYLETLFLMTEDVELVRETHVTKEGQTGEFVYSLVEGTCEIYKQITVEEISSTKGDFERLGSLYRHSKGRVLEISYAKMERGAFIGEEILLEGNDIYNYTVRVISSSATFLRCNKTALLSSFPKECPQGIISSYNIKRQNHKVALSKVLNLRGMTCSAEDITKVGIIRVKKGEQGDLMNYSPNQHHKEKMKRDITPLIITHESVDFKLEIKSPGPTIASPRKLARSVSKRYEPGVEESHHSGSEPSSPVRSLTRMSSLAQISPRMSPTHNQSPTAIHNRKKSNFFTLTPHPVQSDLVFMESQQPHPNENREEPFSPTKRTHGDFGAMMKHFEQMEANSPIPEVSTPSMKNTIKPRPLTTGSSSSRKNGIHESPIPVPKSLFCTRKENDSHFDMNSFVSPKKSSGIKIEVPTQETHFSKAKKSVEKETPQKTPIRFQHIPKLAHFENFIEKMKELKKYNPDNNQAEVINLAANLKAVTGLTQKQEEKLVKTREMLMKHRMGRAYPKGKRISTESLGDFAQKRLNAKHLEIYTKEQTMGDYLIISMPMQIITAPQTSRTNTTRSSPRITKMLNTPQTARAPVKPVVINSNSTAHTRSQSGIDSIVSNANYDLIIESKTASTRISPSWSATKQNSGNFDLDTPTRPKSSKVSNPNLMKRVGGFTTRAGPSSYASPTKEALESVKEVGNNTPKAPEAKKVIRRVKSAHIYVQNGFTANLTS